MMQAKVKKLFAILALSCSALCAQTPPIYVVLFTHIEDNTPVGVIGSPESRQNYSLLRSRLIALASLAKTNGVKWSLQPDWKILLASLQYEDSTQVQSTNRKNVFRYLKEDLDVVIDPHSHENGGFNYTDVAHLLDSLGVGATSVVGGHVWNPGLPQFQEWDRFRVPVRGLKYPWAFWRGAILMGSGTPNHVNDPVVSGVWRPKDRYHYFVDDTAGNIACIGQYKGDINGVDELVGLYKTGSVPLQNILTASYHIRPATITELNGIAAIADSVFKPLMALRSKGQVVLTDFTLLVAEWKSKYNGRASLYDAKNPTHVAASPSQPPVMLALHQNYPNPFNPRTAIRYDLPGGQEELSAVSPLTLKIFDVLGREVVMLVNGTRSAGTHVVQWDSRNARGEFVSSGMYLVVLRAGSYVATRRMVLAK